MADSRYVAATNYASGLIRQNGPVFGINESIIRHVIEFCELTELLYFLIFSYYFILLRNIISYFKIKWHNEKFRLSNIVSKHKVTSFN